MKGQDDCSGDMKVSRVLSLTMIKGWGYCPGSMEAGRLPRLIITKSRGSGDMEANRVLSLKAMEAGLTALVAWKLTRLSRLESWADCPGCMEAGRLPRLTRMEGWLKCPGGIEANRSHGGRRECTSSEAVHFLNPPGSKASDNIHDEAQGADWAGE